MGDIFKDAEKIGGPDIVERALYFVKGERCYLIHEVGPTIEVDLEVCCGRDTEAGPWTEIPKEDGLWIWEGTPGWSDGRTWEGIDEGGEPIYEGRGKARRPNSEELYKIVFGPIERLWGPSQLRAVNTKLCSVHKNGEDPFCDTCYPLVNPPKKCTTCGLLMSDPNHGTKDGPPACPGPEAAR